VSPDTQNIAAGEANPYGYQKLLSRAHWDANAVRDDLLNLVREKLADPTAVVVIDETGFLKKGRASVGVAPQYSGTAGKIANCQIGVFLAYASSKGQVLMDRELYLPHEWTNDPQRCEEAGVPKEVEFATKLVLARRMLERMLSHHLPLAWVTADSIYRADYHLRHFLTEHKIPFVLAVAPNNLVRLGWKDGFEVIRVDEWLARKKSQVRWHRLSAGWGSKGPRWFDWTWWKMDAEVPEGWQTWIVVRRSLSDPTDLTFYRVCAPKKTTLQQIVDVTGQRWKVEETIERGKGECGLDQYEVRSWTGWYRHVTLSLLAQFCATLMMEQAILQSTLPTEAFELRHALFAGLFDGRNPFLKGLLSFAHLLRSPPVIHAAGKIILTAHLRCSFLPSGYLLHHHHFEPARVGFSRCHHLLVLHRYVAFLPSMTTGLARGVRSTPHLLTPPSRYTSFRPPACVREHAPRSDDHHAKEHHIR
jgi:SRSO17 transposase